MRPDLIENFWREVLCVHARPGGERRGQRILQVAREPVHLTRLPCHQCVGLHIEDEVVRCALGPEFRYLPARECVVGGVDLHEGESTRVVSKACLRGTRSLRVENAWRRHCRIRPRGRSDADDPTVMGADWRHRARGERRCDLLDPRIMRTGDVSSLSPQGCSSTTLRGHRSRLSAWSRAGSN